MRHSSASVRRRVLATRGINAGVSRCAALRGISLARSFFFPPETCLLVTFKLYKYNYSVDGNQPVDCLFVIFSTQRPVCFAHAGSDPASASLETAN